LNRDSGRAEPPSFDLDTYHPLQGTYHLRIYGRKVDKFGMRIYLFRQDCSPAPAVQLVCTISAKSNKHYEFTLSTVAGSNTT
jgi:hypothetical protein